MSTKSSCSVRLIVYLVLALLFTPECEGTFISELRSDVKIMMRRLETMDNRIENIETAQAQQIQQTRDVMTRLDTVDNRIENIEIAQAQQTRDVMSRLDNVDNPCDSMGRYEESEESLCLSLQHRQMRDLGEVLADVKTIMSLQAQQTRDVMARLETVDNRFDHMETALAQQTRDVMARLESVDNRFDHMETVQAQQTRDVMSRLDTMDAQLDNMEKVSSTLQSQQQNMMSKIDMLPVTCENRAVEATGLNIACDSNNWIVLQRRVDGAFNFSARNWDEYKKGFGDKEKSFWLGLETMHRLTTTRPAVLRVELTASEDVEGYGTAYKGEMRYAEYSQFRIEGEEEGYRLHLGNYSGTAGDGMRRNNGRKFSTVDRDNDDWSLHCAEDRRGAWWYGRCTSANLNSVYHPTGKGAAGQIIFWDHWLGGGRSYQSVTMKMRWL